MNNFYEIIILMIVWIELQNIKCCGNENPRKQEQPARFSKHKMTLHLIAYEIRLYLGQLEITVGHSVCVVNVFGRSTDFLKLTSAKSVLNYWVRNQFIVKVLAPAIGVSYISRALPDRQQLKQGDVATHRPLVFFPVTTLTEFNFHAALTDSIRC